MATAATMVPKADSPTLERAFAPDLVPNTFVPSKKCEVEFSFPSSRPRPPHRSPTWPNNLASTSSRPGPRSTRRRRLSMVQSTKALPPPMPTFMSVFGEEVNTLRGLQTHRTTAPHGPAVGRPASSGTVLGGASASNPAFAAFHAHRDSTSTLASESTDSSPTTTISTMDSASVTDPSPGPSPESPLPKPTNTSFVADFRSRRTDNGSGDSSPNAFFELQRPTTPAKKPRNLKNLGINTSTSLNNLRASTVRAVPALGASDKVSAPGSPAFIKPPTPPKRRPSNLSLTLQTPGSDSKPMRLVIPSNPVSRPALRHFQSSPSLPLCASPSVLSNGPMRLPPLRPIKTNPHGFAEVPFEQEEEDQEPNFDVPQSREEKPAAYPNGPICIYESGVYLYFEPTAEQATDFDVIINVASEVKNPFTTLVSDSQKDIDARRVDGPPAEDVDFAAIPERTEASLDTQESSPTTPKPTPVMEALPSQEQMVNGSTRRTPEYIHMPWEHNTNIVPDLYKLVKLMDDRVRQGKTILVHCQCGVSRSASLIVAYGLYKNPELSVQEAYDLAKKRSKWIGPNMHLIMQLQEFRNGLLRENRAHNQAYGFPRRSAGLFSAHSTGTNRGSPFDRDVSSGSRTPRTAPLPPETDMNMQRASTGNMISVSPGPLSAPGGQFFSPDFRRSWASSQTRFDLSPKRSPTSAPLIDANGHMVPVQSIPDEKFVPQDPSPEVSQEPATMTGLKPPLAPTVPNFSRQLPFRASMASEYDVDAPDAPPAERTVHLAAPSQPNEHAPLPTPMASTFSIPPLAPAPAGLSRRPGGFPPPRMEFNDAPWSKASDTGSFPAREIGANEPLESPRSTVFSMAPLQHGEIDSSYGVLSPRAAAFDLGPGQLDGSSHHPVYDLEVTSPTVTEFPKNPFARLDEADSDKTQTDGGFRVTTLERRLSNDDPFGMTSPTRFAFPSDPFGLGIRHEPPSPDEPERRPSFQAILPPSHEAFNGFASLNGTAQAAPALGMPPKKLKINDIPDSLRPGPPTWKKAPEPRLAPAPEAPVEKQKTTAFDPTQVPADYLSTPPKPPGIRTRFSSPNMREQRQLHKLQTEMEAMLPNRSPRPQQAVDDLDALMSPRAEEFTRNPFHFDLQSPTDETSPASSIETVKDVRTEAKPADWAVKEQNGNQFPGLGLQVVQDPRSPVQAGSSPIVRNIWDYL